MVRHWRSVDTKMLLLLAVILAAVPAKITSAARCEIIPPAISGSGGIQIGFIIVPGANYPGERYKPLGEAIQMALPGAETWIGLTEGWLIDTPNPVEIAGAITDCTTQAEELGLDGPVYISGHSLGGIMLEQYLQDNFDSVSGIVLFGSYITSFLFENSNNIGIPALTLVGDLDGLTLSYVYREWLESRAGEEEAGVEGMYPVQLVQGVNHAQVGSGEVPGFVKDRDIPAEIPDEEAHQKLAQAVSAFLVLQNYDSFTPQEVESALEVTEQLNQYTETFLEPFGIAANMEANGEYSEWMQRGQKILVGASESQLSSLTVVDHQVPFSDLGDAKPSVEGEGCENIVVNTYSQPQYDTDLFDAAGLISAKVIKAKFKLEDVVREALCLPQQERRQCMDINIEALNVALEMASVVARERFTRIGTQLLFLDDSVSPWGPGWEFSSGLHYNNINSTHTSLYSTSLISEPDFFIQSAAGMHYCDLLSPYRALEWIYISSVVGKA